VLRAAFRRILAVLALTVAGTAAISAALGALSGKSVEHALAVGYYVVGAAVLVGSFAFGSRGPWRAAVADEKEGAPFPFRPRPRRRRRKATPEERTEATRTSVALFLLGLVLIVLGTVVDPSRRAF
jgi:hypothetical protein